MCQCANVPMCQCANVPMCQCGNHLFKSLFNLLGAPIGCSFLWDILSFQYLNICKLVLSFKLLALGLRRLYALKLILLAITAISVPITAMSPNEMRRFVAWAINPIKGGPNKNPRYPIVETAAIATPGDIILDFPTVL